MEFDTEGAMIFKDVYELTYELLVSTMGYNILEADGAIYDPDKNTSITFMGMLIKATINPEDIKYAGQGEIALDLLNNSKLVNSIFGYYLQSKIDQGMPFVSYYTDEKIIEMKKIGDIKYSSLSIKYDSVHVTSSEFYHNKCLKYIDLIFKMEEENVNLKNFDSLDDVIEKG